MCDAVLVSAQRAIISSDLREELTMPPGTPVRAMVPKSYLQIRFQQGVVRRGVDVVCAPEVRGGSANEWIRTP